MHQAAHFQPISMTMIASKIMGCKVTSIKILLCRYDINFAGVLEGGDQCNFCSKLPSKFNSQISSTQKILCSQYPVRVVLVWFLTFISR